MFFKKSKQENKELLQRKNIIVKCDPLTKEDAIKKAGQLLADSGYVDQEYVAAMLEREKTFSTFMGNGLALPHGVEAAKKQVKASGISVVTFKEPIDWDGNPVQTVIGIAGVGDEHLEILSMVAEAMLDEEICENFASYDTDHIYHILTGKE